jgi:hypothetical protein
MKLLEHTYMNFLFMTRDLIDAGIVWFESLEVDEDREGNIPLPSYYKLAEVTGDAIANIVK